MSAVGHERRLLGSLVLAMVVSGAVLGGTKSRVSAKPVLSAAQIREEDIAFFERRIGRDPSGSLDLVRLGALYLERARQTGDEGDFTAAEAAARRSLANRAEGNTSGLQLLAAALLGQHRFVESRKVSERLLRLEPDNAAAQAALGEVLLELGEYPTADRIFGALGSRRYTLALAPRYARWLELRGHAGAARRLLEWARDETKRVDPAATERLAWFELRLGEMALRLGAPGEARRRLDAGLALVPNHWRLLAARARLALELGDWPSAIALGDSSLARHLDPATLALVGDAWHARGDTAQAAEYYQAMEAATRGPSGGFHRAWYLALLNHDRRIPEVLTAVTRDLETRRDVYGYDLLAWARFKSGRISEARTAMALALAWGTEDPQLSAHAKAIEAAR
jgi:tetratricopeptide (TPR) repeat protein